jgi:DMSO/TMAO reductase YedYZ molybdopterin-dependent catalytic subunit
MRSWVPWAIAGVAAAALAVGVAEAVAALLGGSSVIAAVGALVIELQPPGAKDFVVGLFGEADKLALEITTGIGALLVGGLLGLAARRDVRLAHIGFGAFALVAFAVLALEPLFDPLSAAITVVLAAWAGVLSVGWLAARAAESEAAAESETVATVEAAEPLPQRQDLARRRFLLFSVGMLAVGGVLASVGRFLTAQLPTIERPTTLPPPAGTPPPVPAGAAFEVPGLTPIILPSQEIDFYRIDTRLTIPRLDAESWTVRVHGMVERELELSYSELVAMPLIERYVTLSCVSNEVGGHLVGNAKWTGVPLVTVLERAGVKPDASQLVGRSFDGWTAGFPTAHLDGAGSESMIALLMNDDVLPPRHGYPLRLVVPGLYGYVSATKWLTEIELTTLEAFDAYWIPRGWAKEAPILTQSRIDVPRANSTVASGETTMAGVAWAPTRGISAVEVQLDEGPWFEAELSEPLSDYAWVQWMIPLHVPPGNHTLKVRATDGTGEQQTAERTAPAPDGARGYHVISFAAN